MTGYCEEGIKRIGAGRGTTSGARKIYVDDHTDTAEHATVSPRYIYIYIYIYIYTHAHTHRILSRRILFWHYYKWTVVKTVFECYILWELSTVVWIVSWIRRRNQHNSSVSSQSACIIPPSMKRRSHRHKLKPCTKRHSSAALCRSVYRKIDYTKRRYRLRSRWKC